MQSFASIAVNVQSDGFLAQLSHPQHDPLLGPRPAWWWARVHEPTGASPHFSADGTVVSLPALNLATCTRQQVLDYFQNGWLLTEVLFSSLQGAAAFVRPPYHHLRHPMIFYYGHTACFYINKLRTAGLVPGPLNEYFEALFEVGVDEMSWDDMSKNQMAWPAVRDVNAYRKAVFDTVVALIENHPGLAPGHAPVTRESPLWALAMAMEHERIHLETSSVLIRELPLELLSRPRQWPRLHPSFDVQLPAAGSGLGSFVHAGAGEVRLGKPDAAPYYGWDNEYGARSVQVAPFDVSRHMVTNVEFMEFVHAGGYTDRSNWSETGWEWRCYRDAANPSFWVAPDQSQGGRFRLRTTFEEIDLPALWPVCVNFHEAKAYLAWKGRCDQRSYRLLTEAEHALLQRGAAPAVPDDPVALHGSASLARGRRHNLNLAFGSESSVLWGEGDGVTDIGGNLWDWCEDDFNPLDGFQVHPYYDDFSTPCFDGQHSMILGGSFISTGNEASVWSRFHFRPHFIQQAGFHIVAPSTEPSTAVRLARQGNASGKYEEESTLHQYLLFHFGSADDALPAPMRGSRLNEFPQRCAETVVDWARQMECGMQRVLDVGCAVGGASFELARAFGHVEAVDISHSFIAAGRALQQGRALPYQLALEGRIREGRLAAAPAGIDMDRISFRRADACSLPAEYAGFDAVLASNLLCRLPSPRAFLSRLGGARGLVRPGGILVLASPYSWLEAYTTPSAWLGGTEQGNLRQRSHDAVREQLGDDFELVHREDMPFMLREHGRKFEYVVSDLTVWRRKLSSR
jgi:5-histidylcysteine sulfoxide synthase/putative 4-mercaptohistidine N1-methyltranferase